MYTIRFTSTSTHAGIQSVVVAVAPAVVPWQPVFRRLHNVFPFSARVNTCPVLFIFALVADNSGSAALRYQILMTMTTPC